MREHKQLTQTAVKFIFNDSYVYLNLLPETYKKHL